MAQTFSKILARTLCHRGRTILPKPVDVGEMENIIRSCFRPPMGTCNARGNNFIDEIDKICRKTKTPLSRATFRRGCPQQALLTILDSTVAQRAAPGGRKPPQPNFTPGGYYEFCSSAAGPLWVWRR